MILPRRNEGHANAAIPEFAFATAQRSIAGGEFLGGAAVVAEENNERVLFDAAVTELS